MDREVAYLQRGKETSKVLKKIGDGFQLLENGDNLWLFVKSLEARKRTTNRKGGFMMELFKEQLGSGGGESLIFEDLLIK